MAQFLPNSCDPVSIGELRTAHKNGFDPLARFKVYVRSDSLQKLLEDTSVQFERYEDPDSLQKLLEDTKVRFEYEDSHYTVLAPPGKLGFILSYEGGIVLGHTTSNSAMKDKIPPGDQIITVDHVDVTNLTSIEIHKLLVSKAGCQRRLQIRKSIIPKRVIPPRLWKSIDLMTPSTSSHGYHEMESRIQYILEDQTVKDSDTVALVFHGTHHSNNTSILVNGLDPAMRRCQSKGEGEYFSRDPSICIPYCKHSNSMLVFLVIDSSAKKCRMKGERIDLSCVIVKEPRHQFPFGVLHFTWVAGSGDQHRWRRIVHLCNKMQSRRDLRASRCISLVHSTSPAISTAHPKKTKTMDRKGFGRKKNM